MLAKFNCPQKGLYDPDIVSKKRLATDNIIYKFKKELCNNFRRGGMCWIQRSDISCKLANFRRGGMCRIQILDILCKLANFRRGGICARFKDQTYIMQAC